MSSLIIKSMSCKSEKIIVGNSKEGTYEIRKYLYDAMAGHEGTIYSPPYRSTVEVMVLLHDECKINEN